MRHQDPVTRMEKALERKRQIKQAYRAIARGELWLTSDDDYEYLSLAADGANRTVLAVYDELPEALKAQYAPRQDVAELLTERAAKVVED